MKKLFLLFPLFPALIISPLSAQKADLSEVITKDKVEHIISTLSSDSMQGRRAFTPGVEKAARFIAGEFERTGLEPLEGLESYRQPFIVYQFSVDTAALKINGQNIHRRDFFFISNHSEINWDDLSEQEIYNIPASGNFQQAFSQINQAENNTVVLVDTAHKDIFNRYANYFGREARGFNVNVGPTRLFIVTSLDQINSGSFYVTQKVNKREAFNVAGKITGTEHPDKYVLFSAHYDHIGILKPVEGDSIANGADDDASGTTAVMMLAGYFKRLGPQARTVIFVAFTAEEAGGYGSQYFSQQLNPTDIVAMFNIEMIGKPSKFGPNTAFLTGFEMTDMGKILRQNLEKTPYMIYPDPYPGQNLFFRSDNATLARLGVPAHTFSSDQIDKDPYYHTVNDEFETLDLEHLTHMIRAIALSSRSIVSAEDTPIRINTKLN